MQDYKSAISAKIGVNEAFERITRVSDWWTAGTHLSAGTLEDEFTVRWGETFVTFKVTELVPGKSAVWLVTDCNGEGFKDRTEWKAPKWCGICHQKMARHTGAGVRFEPRPGKPMKEWLVVKADSQKWIGLAQEACEFVRHSKP